MSNSKNKVSTLSKIFSTGKQRKAYKSEQYLEDQDYHNRSHNVSNQSYSPEKSLSPRNLSYSPEKSFNDNNLSYTPEKSPGKIEDNQNILKQIGDIIREENKEQNVKLQKLIRDTIYEKNKEQMELFRK